MTECSERIQENMYTWPIPSKNIYHIPLNGVLFSAKYPISSTKIIQNSWKVPFPTMKILIDFNKFFSDDPDQQFQ